MISVSLSFLITSEDFIWILFNWPPCITRYNQLSPKAAKSPRWKGLQRPSGPHCISCRYLPSQHPDRWPSRLCTDAFVFEELLPPAHNQPSLTNHVLHLIVGEIACSPFCCWLSVPSPLWLGLPNTWVTAAGTRAIFFLAWGHFEPFSSSWQSSRFSLISNPFIFCLWLFACIRLQVPGQQPLHPIATVKLSCPPITCWLFL